MKERPILFSAPMVRAILEGTKTQTRRIIKLPSMYEIEERDYGYWPWRYDAETNGDDWAKCPYGQIGDQLWVRETFCPIYPQDPTYNNGRPIEFDYMATYEYGYRMSDLIGEKKKWKPSIHMPRRASRIQLEITGIKVERLHDIGQGGACAEGRPIGFDPLDWYRDQWESINGIHSWDANPWVWVIEFRRIEQ